MNTFFSKTKKGLRCLGGVVLLSSIFCGVSLAKTSAPPPDPYLGEIVGRVFNQTGAPEAGVWVIAEAQEGLPVPYRKIVVTDDNGYFVVPELPKLTNDDCEDRDNFGEHASDVASHKHTATNGNTCNRYDVWVRGYGIRDSQHLYAKPKKNILPTSTSVNVLKFQVYHYDMSNSAEAREDAQNYPADYWFSLYQPPTQAELYPDPNNLPAFSDESNFPDGETPEPEWFVGAIVKGRCFYCHQLGVKKQRESDSTIEDLLLESAFGNIPPGYEFFKTFWLPHKTSVEQVAFKFDLDFDAAAELLFKNFIEWRQRIQDGAYPTERPSRPIDKERNVVITQWDWGVTGELFHFVHDVVSTEKQNPSNPLYSYGKVYGIDFGSSNNMYILDPNVHTVERINLPHLSPDYLPIYQYPRAAHNPMLDSFGNLWMTSSFRPKGTPDFAKEGIWGSYFDFFPTFRGSIALDGGTRQLVKFNIVSKQFELIDTGYDTHHLHFDKHGVLWTSGDWRVVGTYHDPLNTNTDPIARQIEQHGFTPPVLENDNYYFAFHYGLIPSDYDTAPPGNENAPVLSIWTATPDEFFGGGISRFVPYRVPDPNNPARLIPTGLGVSADGTVGPTLGPNNLLNNGPLEFFRHSQGNLPRGIDVTLEKDSNGNVIGNRVFTAFAGTGHIAEFNRHADDVESGSVGYEGGFSDKGWTLWSIPGPKISDTENEEDPNSIADFIYYLWVDQADTLGFGENIVVATGSNSDSLILFDPNENEGEFIARIRVPYPLGFYTRGVDGRIDDINGGWKGKGWWATYSQHFPDEDFVENGSSHVVKFQLRDTPLDR